MLSLMIERLLKKKLAKKWSAREALEILRSCHLNRFVAESKSLYTITEADSDQQRILKKLVMPHQLLNLE